MLSRIIAELMRRFKLEFEIPAKEDELNTAFANCLQMATARGRVVLALDGLNQLEDDNAGALDLTWLPSKIPVGLRLILSTAPGRTFDSARRQGWPILTLEALTTQQRLDFIGRFLALYGKSLTPAQTARVAEATPTASPLFLRTMLEDLRTYGEHETLDCRINHYLSAATPDALYRLILRRYEEDYESHRPGLVRDAMTLIWAARRGLAESELLEPGRRTVATGRVDSSVRCSPVLVD
jgi:nephrocystin-3